MTVAASKAIMHVMFRLSANSLLVLMAVLALGISVSGCRPSIDPATLEALERTRAALDERATALDERSRAIEARIAEIEKKAIESENAALKKEVERLKEESKNLRAEADRAQRDSEKLARQIETERARLPGPQREPMRDQRDYSMFYRELTPHGAWFDVAGYGYCFQPRVAKDPSWRPYLDGRWVWSDRGWAWSSNEPFGWIVYHYGRWLLTTGHGWIWVPDTEWAPAWVSWRRGDEYIGWAPLPPERGPRPPMIGADVDVRCRLGAPHYIFVEVIHFAAPTYVSYCRPIIHNTTIIHNTINITNIIYVGDRNNRHCYIKGGPDRIDIERRCKRPIPIARITHLEPGQSPPEDWATTAHENRKVLHLAALPATTGEPVVPEKVEAQIEPQPVMAEPIDAQPPLVQTDQEQPSVPAQESLPLPLEANGKPDLQDDRNDNQNDQQRQVVAGTEQPERNPGNERIPIVANEPNDVPTEIEPRRNLAGEEGETQDAPVAPTEPVVRIADQPNQETEDPSRIQQAQEEARAAEAAERERQAALERERQEAARAAEEQRRAEQLAREQQEAAAMEAERRAREQAMREEQMERMRLEAEERERRQQEQLARQRQLEEMEQRRAEEEARRRQQMEEMRRQQEEYERRQQEEFARQQREEAEYRRAQEEMELRQREEQERWAAEQRRAHEEAAREQARAQREAEIQAERHRREAEVSIQPFGEEPVE